jgi:hypothetical protein
MDSKVIAALIGLIGISLGALLGGVGYYLKSRSERLQAKKLVLFHLLEFRHLLKSSYVDPKEITAEYLKYCTAIFLKLGVNLDDDVPEELKKLIENHMASLVEAMSPKISPAFIHSFENSLHSLCKDEPVLAFQLRGKEQLTEVLTIQENYIKNFTNSNLFGSYQKDNEVASKQLNDMNNRATKELIKDIDQDISLISRYCGIYTWFNCRSIIKKKSKPKVCFKDTGIEKLLEETFKEFLDSAKKSSDVT